MSEALTQFDRNLAQSTALARAAATGETSLTHVDVCLDLAILLLDGRSPADTRAALVKLREQVRADKAALSAQFDQALRRAA